MNLLTQNSDLKRTGIFGWTLPAHWVSLNNGDRFNTCPNAGVCAAFCYAKSGTYQFSNVKKAHIEKLELVLNAPDEWVRLMNQELTKKKYQGAYVRIHDAGDFFAEWYIYKWFDIARANPSINFYSYTKEVRSFKSLEVAGFIPENFTTIFSFGGRQDSLIDREVDRHSDVFVDYDEMIRSGYVDIADDDKQAAINPNHRIGLYRNNIPGIIKRMNGKSFSAWSGNK